MTRLRNLAAKAGRYWINWSSFKLGVFVGAIIGMLWMAFLMVALMNGARLVP